MAIRIALLGTGRMGSALARRLAGAGAELTLWDRTPDRATALGLGRVAASPAEATREAEFVISSLTGPEAVRETYLGPGGALAMAHGQLFIEMSTAGPDVEAELGPLVVAAGSQLVDATIVGAPPIVERGEAAILIGGDGADVERARPILEHLGTVRHVGRPGNGARLKLVANSMLALVTAGAAELQQAGESAGLDPGIGRPEQPSEAADLNGRGRAVCRCDPADHAGQRAMHHRHAGTGLPTGRSVTGRHGLLRCNVSRNHRQDYADSVNDQEALGSG